MRFLVVDDDSSKVDLLRGELISNGVLPQDIVDADSVVSARRALASGSFDVMLLDVLLPTRRGALPSGANSIELLKEIIDDGTSTAPRYIVGVTAELAAIEAHAVDFSRMTSNVILVTPGEDAWKEFLRNLISFLTKVNASHSAFDVDICVLDALKTPELDAVIHAWPLNLSAEKLLNNSVLYQDGTCTLRRQNFRIVCGYPGQMGPIAATHAATSMLAAFRPRVLLMTGICGGFSEHVSIGDIVVAERSWDWQSGKWSEEGVLLAAPDHREASVELVARARTIEAVTVKEIAESFSGARPSSEPKMLFGPMVTGSSVVASADIQKVFRSQHRKMAAIDMECYGVYYAASVTHGPATKVICVKSVSDLADRGKSDDFHRYCSFLSARVGLEIVSRYLT